MANDVASLPKWAREKIEQLVGENATLKKNLITVKGGDKGSNVYLDIVTSAKIPLPKDSSILFIPESQVGKESPEAFRVRLIDHGKGKQLLEINASSWDGVNVRPVAANAFIVEIRGIDGTQ